MKASIGGLAIFALANACSSSNGMDAAVPVPDSGMTVAATCSDDMPCHLVPGMMQSSYIYPKGHEDPWLFDVPTAGEIIHLKVTNDADFSPVHLQVTLLRNTPTGTIAWTGVRTETFSGNGKQKIEMREVAATAGMYKAVVAAANGDGSDRRNPYFIIMDLGSQTDPNEPNNTRALATPLTANMPKQSTLGYQGDVDWYSIDVPANKLFHVKLTAPAPMMSPDVLFRYELYGPDGMLRIAENDEQVASPPVALVLEENRAIHTMAGKWYVRVSDVNNTNADLMRTYQIGVDFLDDPDTHEPNDTIQTATGVTSGQMVTGYIASKADVDYYSIMIPNAGPMSPQLIAATVTMPNARVSLEMEVLGADGRLVCDGDPECKASRYSVDGTRCANNLATSHVVRAPGVYYVAVRDHGDQHYDTMVPYVLTVENPPEPDMFERYETKKEEGRVIPAITSTLGTSITYDWVEGYISYAGDQDWFIFDIPGPMNAPAGQNGDWLIQFEIAKPGPTPLEFQMFFQASDLEYGGYGKSCGMPMQGACDPTGCYFPPDQNTIPDTIYGEAHGDCIVVFREHTAVGPHYIRITDLNRDREDYRPGVGAYRFQMKITAKCPPTSVCAGHYTDQQGNDLCHRP